MNRLFLTAAALAFIAASQVQAFHPCGGYTYHYRVHGHGVGAPPAVIGQSFSAVPAQSFGVVAPAQSFGFAPALSFGFAPAQSFSLVPAQSFSFSGGMGNPNAGAFALNQDNRTGGFGNTAATAEGLVTPALLSALRIACNLANGGSGPGVSTGSNVDLTALTNEIKGLRETQKSILEELKTLNKKVAPLPSPSEKLDAPKTLNQDKKTTSNTAPVEEQPSEFRSLRDQAERLAAASRPTSSKTDEIVKVSR